MVGASAQVVQTYGARDALRRAKQLDDRTLTLIGGHHASLCPGDFQAPFIDAIVIGEGVAPPREIVELVDRGAVTVDRSGAVGLDGAPGPGAAARRGAALHRATPESIVDELESLD